MTKGKKYDFRIVQNGDCWTAEITRRVTSKKTSVSKKQGQFATESEAKEWAENELKSFMKNQNERNKLRSQKRDLKETELKERELKELESKELKLKERESKKLESEELESELFDSNEPIL